MEEVTGAQEYMNCADKWKNEPAIATKYSTMAKQELEHAKNLNEMLPMVKGTDTFTDEQAAVIKFLVEMNNDQIRRVANR